ncbi:CHAT domain-containing protein [Aquimarina sp. 2304DJ70-9]|uniref:CHAT domain-containing protein n=1 Tax=Aquimarina penaris TaxID=3231044 RepID=UPI003462F369
MAENDVRYLLIEFTKDQIKYTKPKKKLKNSSATDLRQDGLELELTVSQIFHKALNRTRVEGIFKKNDFEVLGKVLFKILCLVDIPEVKNFVYSDLSYILRSDEARCIIVLLFDKDTRNLAMLPWEYLQIMDDNYDNDIEEPFYIAAQKDVKFDLVRYIEYLDGKDSEHDYSPQEQKKLNIITVICSPENDNLNTADFEKCFDDLNKEFQTENNEKVIVARRLKNPSWEKFVEKFKKEVEPKLDGEYILHFYGHARMEKEKPEIAFIDNDGHKQWVSHKKFAALFEKDLNYKKPLAIVMQACESGQTNSKGQGLAVSLIKKGIPFVLAMQNEVTPLTSLAFFKKFYQALLSGHDFFKAVTIGKVFLGREYGIKNPELDREHHYSNNSFGTPVIFTSSLTPLRFFPEKERQSKKDQYILVCTNPDCKEEYPSYSELEHCNTGRCRERLEIKKFIRQEEVQGTAPVLESGKTSLDKNKM